MANEKDTPVTPVEVPRPKSSERLPVEVQRSPTTMDELANMLRDGFRNMNRSLSDANKTIKSVAGEVHDVKDELHKVIVRLEKVEVHAFGEVQLASIPPLTSLAERVSSNEAEIPTIQGRLLAVESAVKDVKDMNKAQSRVMGLAMPDASAFEKAWKFIWSRQGMTSIAALVAAITGLIAALKK